MKCFMFYTGEKKEEPKTPKSMSVQSSNSTLTTNSTLTERDMRRSGSLFNSQNVSDTSTESVGRSQFLSLSQRSSNLKLFTYSELKMATKNFNHTVKLGEGGFGCVYKGVVKRSEDPERKLDVAVKQLGKRGLQGHKEWVTEVNVLGVVEHPNLVKLVGYCAEDDERGIQRLLIYEFMPNKSVEDHLSTKSGTPLPWAMRLKIAQDAARGLAYLHEGMDFQIIFRDFKSSNILLDEQWNAKLSDFGLARFGPPDGRTHVSTAVVGTLGYAAPEYIQTGRLTFKNDIWSYGVFIFELLTGRRPLDRNKPKNEQKLLEWVRPYVSDTKKFKQILDPRLEWNGSLKSTQNLAIVANRCLIRNAKSRPKMSEVLEMVNQIVEASQEIRTSRQPVRSSMLMETSGDKVKGKGRIMDMTTKKPRYAEKLRYTDASNRKVHKALT
ncbi:serine/threonine-protein kinase PCRK1-like [Camellia sinensis]|uniref:serine/threonine-protein kinase PCRK1-like n=1 Tax=Camellia sinensis TaxID=4442 RepID=UPI00103659E5|nr:serine/threonine-protein kinase PCRK1-like [Camellia sinensis]